jgi:signal transduction histidine kinase
VNRRRLAWTIWGVSIALAVVSIVVESFVRSSDGDLGEYAFSFGAIALYATVGALITSQQLGNRIGLIFAWVALTASIGLTAGAYAVLAGERALPFETAATWVANIGPVVMIGPIAFLFLLYPTGRPPSKRWTWLRNVMVVAYVIALVLFGLTPGRMHAGFAAFEGQIRNPLALPDSWKQAIEALTTAFGAVVFIGAFVSFFSLIQRYRKAGATERQQIRWLALLGTVTAACIAVLFPLQATGVMPENGIAANASFYVLIFLIFLGIPITCGIAILKHGLWDLDVVVRKTVQYGVLVVAFTLIVGVLFVVAPAMVVGVGSGAGGLLPLLMGVIVAIGFTFARGRAQRWANRIVYGKRSTPYEVLSEFAERVGETYSTEDVLPRMAQLLGEATGARIARVWLLIGNEMRAEASWPPDAQMARNVAVHGDELPTFGDDDAFDVRHQGELLGTLTVSLAADDPMNATKEKLARDVAAQAGLVLKNVALIEDLRESRRRIVSAQDERARTLERNIHDGAQQQLVALSVKLRLAAGLVERDPAKAHQLLSELQTQSTETLEDLRDLARGIYPPLLADQGLPAALEAQARRSPTPVTIVPDGVGRYGQDVESAVYFSCLEALNNVAKYAEASAVSLRLSQENGWLHFEIEDDGRGFEVAARSYGTGLQGIADRIDALGGRFEVRSRPGAGTTLAGSIPVGASRG